MYFIRPVSAIYLGDLRGFARPSFRARFYVESRQDAKSSSTPRWVLPGKARNRTCNLPNQSVFRNKLSKAARASLVWRGTWSLGPLGGGTLAGLPWAESRATVTRGLNNSHALAWSFTAIRTGTGLRH
jgi:hypothetical protein